MIVDKMNALAVLVVYNSVIVMIVHRLMYALPKEVHSMDWQRNVIRKLAVLVVVETLLMDVPTILLVRNARPQPHTSAVNVVRNRVVRAVRIRRVHRVHRPLSMANRALRLFSVIINAANNVDLVVVNQIVLTTNLNHNVVPTVPFQLVLVIILVVLVVMMVLANSLSAVVNAALVYFKALAAIVAATRVRWAMFVVKTMKINRV